MSAVPTIPANAPARRGVVLLGAVLLACAGPSAGVLPPEGSVGVSEFASLDALAGESGGGTVAMVLPPLEPSRPERVVLARRAAASPAVVLARLRDVERYPEFVDQLDQVFVREADGESLLFDASLSLPFQDLEYSLRYRFAEDGRVDVTGEEGVLAGGRWCWQAFPIDEGSLVVYTSEGDLGEGAGLVLRALLDSHPDLQPGLAFAQGLRFLRSICDAAERAAGKDAP